MKTEIYNSLIAELDKRIGIISELNFNDALDAEYYEGKATAYTELKQYINYLANGEKLTDEQIVANFNKRFKEFDKK